MRRTRPRCSWPRWPARRSRAITSPTRRAGFCARLGPTSSWSSLLTRRADRRIHPLGRLVLAGGIAAALPRGRYLPGADDRAGFAQPHVGRGDGVGHSRHRQPHRRVAVYGHRWRDRATCASRATRLISPARSPGCLMITELRRQMGLAGRKRFEEDFLWEDVIERHFRPVLGSPTAKGTERRELKNSGV